MTVFRFIPRLMRIIGSSGGCGREMCVEFFIPRLVCCSQSLRRVLIMIADEWYVLLWIYVKQLMAFIYV